MAQIKTRRTYKYALMRSIQNKLIVFFYDTAIVDSSTAQPPMSGKYNDPQSNSTENSFHFGTIKPNCYLYVKWTDHGRY